MIKNEKASILIVDDNPGKRLALISVLEGLDQNLVSAESGRDALRLLLSHEYAVILLDVQMPDMNGFETAALIRSRNQSKYTPIIFVTAYTRAETDMLQGYSLGAVDYIFTPIIPEILRAKVCVFVDLYQKTQAIKQHEQQLREIEAGEHEKRMAETTERLEIETQRNRFFTLSVELLAIAGFDSYFKQLNPTWEKTLGYSAQELRDKSLLDLIHPDDRATADAEWQKQTTGAATGFFETRCQCKDGSYRWLSWSTAAFSEEGLIYIFARDITQRKFFEQALQDKNIELEATNKELEAFSHSVSHDLRAPLRHIEGFSRILVQDYRDCLDDQGKEYLRWVRDSTERMAQLIEDILELSRVTRSDMRREKTDLARIAQEVIEGLEKGESGRNVVFETPAEVSAVCDPRLVRIVLENLLSNAWKFTGKRADPRIEFGAREIEGKRIYYVRDNGAGFDMAYAQRLFGAFQRLHSDKEFPGTGIGLATVQRIVHRHGGRIWAEAEIEKGATFYFTV